VTQPGSLAGLLGTPVRVATVRIGEVSGVFVDHTWTRAIGLEVATAGGARRFLPWVAATCVEGGVAVSSPLLLVDDGQSYERLGAHALREADAVAGLVVHPDGRLERPPAVSSAALAGTSER
jgi:hypothetical protein